MQTRLSKFQRQPERIPNCILTPRSLQIIHTISRCGFVPGTTLTHLVPGNTRTVQRHLPWLYHLGLVNRFAFTGPASQFNYYLDSSDALRLLVDQTDHIRHAVKPGITGWAQINCR